MDQCANIVDGFLFDLRILLKMEQQKNYPEKELLLFFTSSLCKLALYKDGEVFVCLCSTSIS